MRRRQLISIDEAVPAKRQHVRPCSDCPWSRQALKGWLGGLSTDDWLRAAHGEELIECHIMTGAQCAGAAIYRSNVCKRVRSPEALVLPAEKTAVFATPTEFREHHQLKRETLDG